MKDVLAVILAGGKGSRLEPLTRDRAKPAVPFGGAYRIIDFTLSNCLNSGMRRNLVLTQYKAMSLDRHIHLGWQSYLCRELGEFIEVLPPQQRIDEHWYQGTADAVYQNIYTIEKERPEVRRDPGRRPHLQDELRQAGRAPHRDQRRPDGRHAAGGRAGGGRPVRRVGGRRRQPRDGLRGEADRIRNRSPAIRTGPWPRWGSTSARRRFLFEQLCLDATRHGSPHDFGRDIIPSMVESHRVFAYPFMDENRKKEAYWRDVGTLDAYYDANMDLISVDPQLNMYDAEWPIRTYQPNLPPPKFVFAEKGAGARCGQALDSIVCQGCDHLGRTVGADDPRPELPHQQLRPSGRFDPVRRGQRRPAREDPPGDHRQGGPHPRRHRDRLRPRPRPQPRLHRSARKASRSSPRPTASSISATSPTRTRWRQRDSIADEVSPAASWHVTPVGDDPRRG